MRFAPRSPEGSVNNLPVENRHATHVGELKHARRGLFKKIGAVIGATVLGTVLMTQTPVGGWVHDGIQAWNHLEESDAGTDNINHPTIEPTITHETK